jgi:hypothetical protein
MLEHFGWGVFVIQEEVSACFVVTLRSDCNVLALSSESSDVMRQAGSVSVKLLGNWTGGVH